MEETVIMKFWLFVRFWSCPYLVIMKRHTVPLRLLGLPEATRRLGTDEEGCVRVEQWSATRIFASASELWHTSEASIRLAGSVPWHVLTLFAILMSSPNSSYRILSLSEECCRFLCDMDYVWTYCMPLYCVDIQLSMYNMYTGYIMKLTFDMTWYLDTFITSYPSMTLCLRLAAAPEFGECLKQVLAETRSKRPESLYRSELDPKT